MLIGYARISTQDQDLRPQFDALTAAGCETIYQEKASGGKRERPELKLLLSHIQPGDTLVVWKLDRLSRSLKDLIGIIEKLEKAGAGFRSLTEAVDTTTPAGRMMMQMLGSFAEFERAMMLERTHAGLIAARQQGRHGGRPSKLTTRQKQEVVERIRNGETAADVARSFNVDRTMIGRIMAKVEPSV
jgi:DNA invertase Pin-like site-specific DNA recombinase